MTATIARRFVRTWDRDRWQLVALSVPLVRALLFVIDLSPSQLSDESIPNPWQTILLGLLGVSAAIAIVGVLRARPIVERAGLHALGPLGIIYGVGSLASEPTRGAVTLVVYGMIAACCFSRAREITKSMRIVNRVLTP